MRGEIADEVQQADAMTPQRTTADLTSRRNAR